VRRLRVRAVVVLRAARFRAASHAVV